MHATNQEKRTTDIDGKHHYGQGKSVSAGDPLFGYFGRLTANASEVFTERPELPRYGRNCRHASCVFTNQDAVLCFGGAVESEAAPDKDIAPIRELCWAQGSNRLL